MRCSVDVRGTQSEWGIPCDLSRDAVDAMRADGLDVKVIENTIPGWIADLGLTRPWCFMQDLWNFKNPFA